MVVDYSSIEPLKAMTTTALRELLLVAVEVQTQESSVRLLLAASVLSSWAAVVLNFVMFRDLIDMLTCCLLPC
jgi:hypothetical protein